MCMCMYMYVYIHIYIYIYICPQTPQGTSLLLFTALHAGSKETTQLHAKRRSFGECHVFAMYYTFWSMSMHLCLSTLHTLELSGRNKKPNRTVSFRNRPEPDAETNRTEASHETSVKCGPNRVEPGNLIDPTEPHRTAPHRTEPNRTAAAALGSALRPRPDQQIQLLVEQRKEHKTNGKTINI